jgi:hypothetical protein
MTDVPLREHLEHKIDSLREHIDLRFDAAADALRLQAEKNERHFESLNHEQARLLSDRERYLQKEVHEPWKKDVEKSIESINKVLATTAGGGTAKHSVFNALAIIVSLITGFVVAWFTRT